MKCPACGEPDLERVSGSFGDEAPSYLCRHCGQLVAPQQPETPPPAGEGSADYPETP